jgi:hypothetical protein
MLLSLAKQIHPPITSAGFTAGGSVLDYRLGKGDAYTLGVEEEHMLLDPDSFDLVQHVEAILADMSGNELEHRVTRELMQSVLELPRPCAGAPPTSRCSCARSAGTWPSRSARTPPGGRRRSG